MNIWSKMVSALRGSVNEAGEAIIDTQALRILDQEIRDADTELREAKEALAGIMAKHKLAKMEVKKITDKAGEYEQYAIKALEANNEDLAREVAGKIAKLEQELEEAEKNAEGYKQSVEQLRKAVTQNEQHITRLKQQADTVRATENVQKAQIAVAQRYGGSQAKIHSALDSLERIKKRQAEQAANLEAKAELASENNQDEQLEDKLRSAGIIPEQHNAEDILTRLKGKIESGE